MATNRTRLSHHAATTGRNLENGNAIANSITAMSADQITVGSALNANGVTYDVWTITTGFVAPK